MGFDGSQMKLAVEDQGVDVVEEVHSVLFLIVVRH